MATVNSETNKEYILSVKLALDPEINRALQTLGNMRSELNRTASELKKSASAFAAQGGDSTKAAEALRRYQDALKGVGTGSGAAKSSLDGWSASLNQLETELTTLPQKLEIVRKKLAELQAAGKTGGPTWQAYSSELARLVDTSRKMDAASTGTANNFRGMRAAVQNASYQLTDMTVQLQMGTNAMVAIGQQVPQLLGGFGALGASVGLVVALAAALAGPLIAAMTKAAATSDELEKATSSAMDSLKSIEKIDLSNLAQTFLDADASGRRFGLTVIQINLAIAKLSQLDVSKGVNAYFDEAQKKASGFIATAKEVGGAVIGKGYTSDPLKRMANDLKLTSVEMETGIEFQKQYAKSLTKGSAEIEKAGGAYTKWLESVAPASAEARAFAIEQAKGVQTNVLATRQIEALTEAEGKFAAGKAGDYIKGTGGAAKKSAKEAKAFQDALSSLQLLMQDFGKGVESRGVASEQLKALGDPAVVANLTAMGVSISEINTKMVELRAVVNQDDIVAKAFDSLVLYNEQWDLYTKKMMEVIRLNTEGIITLDQMNAVLEQMSNSAPAFRETAKAVEQVKDPLNELGVAIGATLANSLDSLTDALFNSSKSFGEWATNVIKEIAKVLIKMAALAIAKKALAGTAIGAFFGMAQGSELSKGTVGLTKNQILTKPTPFLFAQGGVFSSSGMRSGIAGEAGPEAVVPLKRMPGNDLGVGASPVAITINNTTAQDTDVKVQETNKPDGTREITLTIRKELKSALSDGSMDSVLRTNYGTSRKAIA